LPVCRKAHKFLLSTKYEFAASRITAKLISDTACGFVAAHNPPRLHFEEKQLTSNMKHTTITSEQMYIKHLPPKKCIIAFSQPHHFGEEEPQRFLASPRTGTTAQTDLGILPYGIELILEPSPNGSGHYDHLRRHGS